MDNDLRRTIIIDNFQNPTNKKTIEDESFISANTHSDSCIDNVTLFVKFNGDLIEDIRFDGEACAICTSSTSIMIDTLIGKTKEEAKNILNNFLNMIDEKEYDESVLEQAIVYNDIAKQPNRKKCALLSWWGIEKILKELEK